MLSRSSRGRRSKKSQGGEAIAGFVYLVGGSAIFYAISPQWFFITLIATIVLIKGLVWSFRKRVVRPAHDIQSATELSSREAGPIYSSERARIEFPLVDLTVGQAEELISRTDKLTKERLKAFVEIGSTIHVRDLQLADIKQCRQFQGRVSLFLRKVTDDPDARLIRVDQPLQNDENGKLVSGRLVMSSISRNAIRVALSNGFVV